MAIYHFSAQIIGRSKGRSAVAAAAYRSGERLVNEQTGEIKSYKRETQPENMILAPSHAPEWAKDRQCLWNEVEKVEKNRNSQLAREINVALPVELSNDRQRELIKNYVQDQFVDKGMVADIAIHRDDKNNPHAHVMLTMRQFNEDGEWGNKKRKEYKFHENGEKILKPNGTPDYDTVSLTNWDQRETLENWREQWSIYANRELERANVPDRITHLSHEARGLETLPTLHLGYKANQMEKEGIPTHVGELNRDRQEYNKVVQDLNKYREQKQQLEKQREQWKYFSPAEKASVKKAAQLLGTRISLSSVEKRLKSIDRWEESLTKSNDVLRSKENLYEKANEEYSKIDRCNDHIKEFKEKIDSINWLNPLKFKENRHDKTYYESRISQFENEIEGSKEKLQKIGSELGFKTREEFSEGKDNFEVEKADKRASNANDRAQIKEQREILNKARTSFRNATVRQVAAKYPDWKQAKYLTYEDAMKLNRFNKENGRVVPVKEIKKEYDRLTGNRDSINNKINIISHHKSRLKTAEIYLNNFEKADKKVQKFEKKFWLSKSNKHEYNNALNDRDNNKELMKKYGVEDRQDFNEQLEKLGKAEQKVPGLERGLKALDSSLNVIDTVVKAVERAGKAHDFDQKRLEMQRKPKKFKQQQQEQER